MSPDSSTLTWKIPWMEEPGRLQSMGLRRVWHDWATSLSVFTFMHWRRNGNPLQCSCLENPRDGGAWWATVYRVKQSRTQLKWLSSSGPPRHGLLYSSGVGHFSYVNWTRRDPSQVWRNVSPSWEREGWEEPLYFLGAPSLTVGRKLERLFRGLMLSAMFESVKSETRLVVSSPGIESGSTALQVNSFRFVCNNLFLSVLALCNNSRNYWVGKIPWERKGYPLQYWASLVVRQ